jgi:PleD family two-component response regulator
MAPVEPQVLIIEDDKDAAGFFKTVLNLVGFECQIILSAKEALARLALSTPDLILLDIRLGLEISGEDILYQIRSNTRFDKTRVVVVTAYPRLAEPITELADLVLLKPVDVDQLKSLVQRMGDLDFKPKHHLFRDPITELFNEEFFLTRLELAFERAKRRPQFHFAVAVLELQLDSRKPEPITPDRLLEILREIASRLKGYVRPTDAVARISGWKFATLHEDLNGPDDIQTILSRMYEKLSQPYWIGGESFSLKISLGAVVHDAYFQQPNDLLVAASKAVKEVPAGDHSTG